VKPPYRKNYNRRHYYLILYLNIVNFEVLRAITGKLGIKLVNIFRNTLGNV